MLQRLETDWLQNLSIATRRGTQPSLSWILALVLVPHIANSDTYTVVAGTIDKGVEIAVPAEFRLASTRPELERRERLLNYYRLNKKIRGTYSEIFRSDWSTTYPYPTIIVSTLGTTEKSQGRITESNWTELRQLFQNASSQQMAEYRKKYQPGIRSDMPVDYDVMQEMAWVDGEYDDRAVMVLLSEWQSDDIRYVELAARAMMYYAGYIIVLDFKEDASKPNATQRLREWVEETRIVSIGGP